MWWNREFSTFRNSRQLLSQRLRLIIKILLLIDNISELLLLLLDLTGLSKLLLLLFEHRSDDRNGGRFNQSIELSLPLVTQLLDLMVGLASLLERYEVIGLHEVTNRAMAAVALVRIQRLLGLFEQPRALFRVELVDVDATSRRYTASFSSALNARLATACSCPQLFRALSLLLLLLLRTLWLLVEEVGDASQTARSWHVVRCWAMFITTD